MPKVTFIHPEGRSGDVPEGMSLLEASQLIGFALPHDCGGNASCTTCRVEVLVGGEHLSEIDFDEQDLLDREALTESFHRLGCQARLYGDVMVQVPEHKWDLPASREVTSEERRG